MIIGKNNEAIVFRNPVFHRTHDGKVDQVKRGSKTAKHKAIFTKYFDLIYERTDKELQVVDTDGVEHKAVVFRYVEIKPIVNKNGRMNRFD